MYCKHCGREIDDRSRVCENCGVTVVDAPVTIDDNGGFGWGILGCCIPIVGLILYLVWNDIKPNTAKAAGMVALI